MIASIFPESNHTGPNHAGQTEASPAAGAAHQHVDTAKGEEGGAEAEAQPPFSRKMTTAVAIADCAGAVPLKVPLVLTMAAMILRLWVYAQVVYIHGYAS